MKNEALDRIWGNINAGMRYGRDFLNVAYPFFEEVLYIGTGTGLKKYIFWRHYGSSANRVTKADLRWVIETIFRMTPEEFERAYEAR